jgi:subtilisin family serine protease
MRKFSAVILSFIVLLSFGLQAQNYSSYLIKMKKANQFSFMQNHFTIKPAINTNFAKQVAGSELEKYLLVPKENMNLEQVNKLIEDGIIDFIEPNYIFKVEDVVTPNDQFFDEQWALKNINAQAAWRISTGKDIIVGIVDTGIEYNHPDLQGQIKFNEKEDLNQNGTFEPWSFEVEKDGLTGDYNGIDDDGNGYIDDVAGYDFVDQEIQNINDFRTPDPYADDEHKHGTAVAGVIAAKNNNEIGVTGLAYDAKVLPVRTFDVWGDGESDDIAAGIVYLAVNGVDVINMSFGENTNSRFLQDAIDFAAGKGIVLVASAGNNNWTYRHYPSDFNEVICVGNSTSANQKGGLSNYGSQVDLFAPGTDIKTTGLDNSYINIGGTSFSSPYVAAAAALLLSVQPDLTPADVKGIIVSSANDVNGGGWDSELGAGILDVEKMLNYHGKSRIEITSPENDSQFDKRLMDIVELKGYASHPLFESGEVVYGAGLNPERWTSVYKFDRQFFDDKICTLDLSQFIDTNIIRYQTTTRVDTVITKDTVYTVALKIKLKNNKSLEDRIFIDVTSGNKPLKITHARAVNVWDGAERKILVTATGNFESYCYVEYSKVGEEKLTKKYDNYDISKEHKIILDDLEPNVEYNGSVWVYHSNNNRYGKQLTFTLKTDNFTQDNFSIKPDMTINQRLYFTPEVGKINGQDAIATNDFHALELGDPLIWSYNQGEFTKIDSLIDGDWVIKDFGDTDGDGKDEILVVQPGKSRLYEEPNDSSKSIFDNRTFESSPFVAAWGDQLYDIDNDGKDELICYTDVDNMNHVSYYFYDYDGSEYVIKDTIVVPYDMRGFTPVINTALADFDLDGNNEIAYCNIYGQLFIYEYNNSGFELEYIDSTLKQYSNCYLEAADTDGDGKSELHFLKIESNELFGVVDGTKAIWSYRILEAKENNEWEQIRIDHFIGGREDNPYVFKNGMTSGDLNNDGKDEIVFLMMPNVYVMTYDDDKESLMPMWNYPATLSNNAVIHDFDGNGINELGFSGFNATVFYELNSEKSRPGTPTNLSAEVLGEDSAILSWNAVDNAEYYKIAIIEDNQAIVYDQKITDTEIEFVKPEGGDLYTFSVLAANESFDDTLSYFSEIVDVFYHSLIDTVSIEIKNLEPTTLELTFNGTLGRNFIDISNFHVSLNDNHIEPVNSVLTTGDSQAVLTFENNLAEGIYNLEIEPFYDRYNGKSKPISTTFELKHEEYPKELYLTHLEKQGGVLLELFFSEKVDSASASNPENYILKPFGSIIDAGVSPMDSMSVQVVLSPWLNGNQARGVEFTITAKDIFAVSGNEMTKGAGNTLGFVVSASTNAGAYVYPQPMSLNKEPLITFAGLTDYAEIQIITMMDGEVIQTLYETDGNGGYQWDCRDKNGRLVRPGVYLFKVNGKNTKGEEKYEETKKFIILP